MIKKLRWKFVCINMVIVSIMLLGILLLTVNMTGRSLEEESLNTLRSSYMPDKKDQPPEGKKEDKGQKPTNAPTETAPGMETVSSGDNSSESPVESAGGNQGGGKGGKDAKERKEFRLPTFTLTYTDTGELIAEGNEAYDLSDPDYLENIMAEAQGKGTEHGVLWHHSLRFLRNTDNGNSYSFMDISNEVSTLWKLMLDSFIVGVLAFGGFLILSIFLSRWAVRPVERAWEQQQQFVADASHELKTPLTVIITGAELLEEGNLPPETQKHCVSNILETSRRMRSLTEEMLTLAKAENVQEEMLGNTCSLSELLEDCALSFEPLFFEEGLELQYDIEADISVKGNEDQLRRLGDLFLDNARKYSLPGTTILTLKKYGSRSCELCLSNPAEPMGEEELERLFERFYRADQARTATGSYGLGLAIANGIVRRHRGTIKATQRAGRLSFCVRLPLA